MLNINWTQLRAIMQLIELISLLLLVQSVNLPMLLWISLTLQSPLAGKSFKSMKFDNFKKANIFKIKVIQRTVFHTLFCYQLPVFSFILFWQLLTHQNGHSHFLFYAVFQCLSCTVSANLKLLERIWDLIFLMIWIVATGILNSCVYCVASIFPMEYVNAVILGNVNHSIKIFFKFGQRF